MTWIYEIVKNENEQEIDNGFALKNARWEQFKGLLERYLKDQTPFEGGDVVSLTEWINTVQGAIIKTGKKSIPTRKRRWEAVPCWNQEACLSRKTVLVAEYRRVLNRYVHAVRRAKQASFESLVTESSSVDPWGIVYK